MSIVHINAKVYTEPGNPTLYGVTMRAPHDKLGSRQYNSVNVHRVAHSLTETLEQYFPEGSRLCKKCDKKAALHLLNVINL